MLQKLQKGSRLDLYPFINIIYHGRILSRSLVQISLRLLIWRAYISLLLQDR